MFLSAAASTVPTMQMSVDASIAAITSGVKPGELSTTIQSTVARSTSNSWRRKPTVTLAAWSGRAGA